MTLRAQLATVGLLALLATLPPGAHAQTSVYEQLQTFSGLLNQIRLNYVDSVTPEGLVRGAITGMLASLDPHSHFLPRADAERMFAYQSGRLGGTGITVEDADDFVVVQAVMRRSPAQRGGVQPGDRILAINDTTMAGRRAPSVQARLFGERGRRVRVRLERGSRLEPETVSVTLRLDHLQPQSVSLARSLAPGIGYVRLDEFGERAARELKDAANRVMRGGGQRRLILDLRGNPGGIVDQAQAVAALFLRRDQLVFRTRGRRRETDREIRTEGDGDLRDVALIVLIDERSASASEAVAGSLQDHDRALVMGRRSFGKALMQRAFDVPPQGDAVMLTVGYVVLPSGRLIQRPYRGMTPAQYYALAGRPGAELDAAGNEYRTSGGRLVHGGGGIEPDSTLPAPTSLPAWFTVAADSGLFLAVADSVAQSLPAHDASRASWFDAPTRWRAALLEPFLARTRERLGVAAQPDSALAARLGRILADRVVEVRWGAEAEEDFRLRHDPGVRAAHDAIPRVPVLIAPPR